MGEGERAVVSGKSGSVSADAGQSQHGQPVHGSDGDELAPHSAETATVRKEKKLICNGVLLGPPFFLFVDSYLPDKPRRV
jgi:hypothetical protein